MFVDSILHWICKCIYILYMRKRTEIDILYELFSITLLLKKTVDEFFEVVCIDFVSYLKSITYVISIHDFTLFVLDDCILIWIVDLDCFHIEEDRWWCLCLVLNVGIVFSFWIVKKWLFYMKIQLDYYLFRKNIFYSFMLIFNYGMIWFERKTFHWKNWKWESFLLCGCNYTPYK